MIVSKTDKIPTKKIIAVLEKVLIEIAEDFFGAREVTAKQTLIRKAKTMGADAIIKFSKFTILGIKTTYTGLAVTTEDIIPIQ